MKILNTQCDENSLTKFGAEAARLIKERNYQELADCFGYALAFGKDPAGAIQSDIANSLSQSGHEDQLSVSGPVSITVKYLAANDSNLFAVVECMLPVQNSPGFVLAELVVSGKDNEKYLSLEQISFTA